MKSIMSKQEVILCESLEKSLIHAIERCPHDKLFILTDEHTRRLCLPALVNLPEIKEAVSITIGAEDVHKTLETLASVWTALSNQGATRHSLLINLGGGMVTDLGGFAAATFKRGMAYINLPTTLLAMVDASVGGKTGINFNGLKNEIGAFAPASSVLIETDFLRTLDAANFFSGYAEMLKHGLISRTDHWAELLNFDTAHIDFRVLKQLVGQSVQVKEEIVAQDPYEKGIRKALNLGHTVGHAFESLALAENRPVLHGYAVAWGMVCELYLSHLRVGFPKDKMRQTIQFIKESYGIFHFDCKKYEQLYAYMTHDKKNTSGIINFTLLKEIGDICINQTADKETIFEMFDFYRECMGV
ncbi:3-dehydroquinate synthase [gut metagenome]|uniref:3-dehydroquinate synthase n=1 Tax=gut metagenome TaxID=749906 RepID=J9GNJ4_9ZZZZ